MAAETLLREVEEKRKNTLDALESEYSAKIADLKKNAEQEKKRLLDEAKKQAQELAQREKIRIDGAAKLQAKKMMFDATEKMLQNNLEALRNALSEWSGSKDYRELIPKMAKYASTRLGGEIKVICRQADVETFKKAGVEIESSDLSTMGGFKAEKKDGTLELDLTFEELLRGREDEVRRLIFSGE